MKKLLELEEKLKKAKESLEKQGWFGLGGTSTSGQSGGASQGTAGATGGTGNMKTNVGALFGAKKSEDEEDDKEDKKTAQKEVDKHNEKKHGEAKSEDSAIEKGCAEVVKFEKNGQWSMKKYDRLEEKEKRMIDKNLTNAPFKGGTKGAKLHDRKVKSGESQPLRNYGKKFTTGQSVKRTD